MKVFYNRDVRALIYFTRELPGLSNDLELAGFQVYEALAPLGSVLSRGAASGRSHPLDHTVEDGAANEIAQHYSTFRLTRNTTAADVLWELSSSSIEGRSSESGKRANAKGRAARKRSNDGSLSPLWQLFAVKILIAAVSEHPVSFARPPHPIRRTKLSLLLAHTDKGERCLQN